MTILNVNNNNVNSVSASAMDSFISGLDPSLILAHLQQSIETINEDIQTRSTVIYQRNELRRQLLDAKQTVDNFKNFLPVDGDGNIQWDDNYSLEELLELPNLPEDFRQFISTHYLPDSDENGESEIILNIRYVVEDYLADRSPDLFGEKGAYKNLLSQITGTSPKNELSSCIDLEIQELTTNDELEMLQLQNLVKKYDSIMQATSNVINQIYTTQNSIIRNIGG